MKKIILILFLVFSLVSCEEKNILNINNEDNEIKSEDNIKIKDITGKKQDIGFFYKKDEYNLYYPIQKASGYNIVDIEGIDISTFEIVNETFSSENIFAKDKNNVYQKNELNPNGNFEIVKGANPKNFKYGIGIFGKDDKRIYNNYVKIKDIPDVKTFKLIDGVYRDKDYIYNYYRELSAQYINRNLFKEELRIVNGANYETYEKYKFGFHKDKNYIYLNGYKIYGSNSNKELIDLGTGYFFNNGIIYRVNFMSKEKYKYSEIKIIEKDFKEKKLKDIIITNDYTCGPLDFSKGIIYFSEKELPKKISCD